MEEIQLKIIDHLGHLDPRGAIAEMDKTIRTVTQIIEQGLHIKTVTSEGGHLFWELSETLDVPMQSVLDWCREWVSTARKQLREDKFGVSEVEA